MRAKGGAGRSVTEQARRAQIVAATIGTIAELGYRRTSYAEIARRAGLSSTGMISYHFAGKAELMSEVLAEVHAGIGAFMAERVGAQPGPPEQLRAYLEGMVEYLDRHRAPMRALLEIFLNAPAETTGTAAETTDTAAETTDTAAETTGGDAGTTTPGGTAGTGEGGATGPGDRSSADADRRALGALEGILAEGQRRGDFRDFDVQIMAMTIQRSLDMLPFALAADPDLDLARCARELTTLFDLGTRREP
ncbi:TetR/AcrR family transcriptional regulator [Micromonospora cathayae]|uniref:TetR family transcriptional regulator n=1 Tax=Micromonospora cathayae TaxID=3028804 RepID=A0ABY7ZUS8_9ACTN|nr:TetR family transcriptional regulator [Micromonospora sp. HUAS 3]WDZ86253.1 TetR family transcriptional regulator [Micromonospora sp. HUAS 3]